MGLAELLALAGEDERAAWERLSLGYASTGGLTSLREATADLHGDQVGPDEILTFSGAQEAIYCVMMALVGPGDHVVTFRPGYEDLWALPEVLGAETTAIPLEARRDFRPDLSRLADALRPGARLLVLNFPHNPTGAHLTRDELETILGLAADAGAYVLSDEVFRLLTHREEDVLPPAADLYERAISLDVMSKALGLGGVRVGWIACRDRAVLDAALAVKSHTSICNGAPDEILALIALRSRDRILERNRAIVLENLRALDPFMDRNADRIGWVRPAAGCLALPEVAGDVGALAERLATKHGILILPAHLFGGEGNRFRLGFGRADLTTLLPALESQL